jgi:hypothetical protein
LITDDTGVGTINDDDTDPTASIADASVDEGTGVLTFTVSLDAPSGRVIEIDATTSDVSALDGEDYTGATETVQIAAGLTEGTFAVTLLDDTTHEGDETFGVALSGEVNVTLGTSTATGTITDDDPVPTLDVQTGSASESDGTMTVTVALSNPTVDDVTADWMTANDTAAADEDYTAGSGQLAIPAGATSTTFDVTLLGDTTDEPAETFTITLSSVVGATAGSDGPLTLTDDDATPTALTLKVVKTATKVKAKGLLEPAVKDLAVKVTLQKKKDGKYVKVATKTATVRYLRDRDGDGKKDAAYVAAFPRPRAGNYRFKVVFAGTADLLRSTKSARFKL